MSLTSIVYLALLWGAYRLGHFNATQPGAATAHASHAWFRLCEWLKKGK